MQIKKKIVPKTKLALLFIDVPFRNVVIGKLAYKVGIVRFLQEIIDEKKIKFLTSSNMHIRVCRKHVRNA